MTAQSVRCPPAGSQPGADLTIRRVAPMLAIAHHIPGRVRLRLAVGTEAGMAATLAEAQQFLRSVTAMVGIRSVNLNPVARSCVVEYDPKVIPPAAWQDLVGGVRSEDAEALVRALADAAT